MAGELAVHNDPDEGTVIGVRQEKCSQAADAHSDTFACASFSGDSTSRYRCTNLGLRMPLQPRPRPHSGR